MAEDGRTVGVVAATLMVCGNIMGSGVFLLPSSLAAVGGVAIYGWVVTIIGAMSLAIVYAKFASFDDSAGGSYAYVKKGLGNYMGYQTNLVYWLAGWTGNIAMAIIGVGYLAYFLPFINTPFLSAVAAIGVIWLFTFINILGPKLVTTVQSYTTSLVFLPIFGTAIFGWFWFSGDTYMSAWNVSGGSTVSAIQSILNVTLWAFLGVETAAVVAGTVKNPKKNVPIATLGGVGIAAVAYILSSTAIMGIIPNAELVASAAPFSDAWEIMLGPWAGYLVAICAAAGCLGSLGGWTLVVGQTAKAAADDGLFPKFFAKTNAIGVPAPGLIAIAVAMTVICLLTISPTAADQFAAISSIAVIMTLLPYIYTASSLKILGEKEFGASRWFWNAVIVIAVVYSSWAIVGSDSSQVVWSFVFVTIITLMFAFNQSGKSKLVPQKPVAKEM
ncbi:arginine/agmatine antiporter [Pseudooceanicola sp. LIPI14-2-Ac024]|uniref:arginine/agmatine antiporter n=1 Tax=Pseudooceanicola sp. LIPI14-2-Ac024 TaxID=3344875 RepID=UPI0035CFEEF4